MDLNDIFSRTDTSMPSMLSELIETQCMVKSMLRVVIAELSDGNPNKEQEMVELANKLKDKELLRVVARFTEERED